MSMQRVVWRLLGTMLVLLVLAAHSSAQFLSSKEKRERAIAMELDVDSQELVTLERETAHAMALNNSSFFQRLYSDDYVGVAANGEILDKSALVGYIQRSTIKYVTFVATNIDVRVYGPSAVVTCTWTARGQQDGRNFSRQYRVIHIYINGGHTGAWKVVASQETMLPG